MNLFASVGSGQVHSWLVSRDIFLETSQLKLQICFSVLCLLNFCMMYWYKRETHSQLLLLQLRKLLTYTCVSILKICLAQKRKQWSRIFQFWHNNYACHSAVQTVFITSSGAWKLGGFGFAITVDQASGGSASMQSFHYPVSSSFLLWYVEFCKFCVKIALIDNVYIVFKLLEFFGTSCFYHSTY